MSIVTIIVSVFPLLVLLTGGTFLQIFLSSRENKWLGLILPAICFVFSLLTLLQLMVPPDEKQIIFMLASTFLLANIPTIVLLGVYFACRQRFKRRAKLEKMSVQDL